MTIDRVLADLFPREEGVQYWRREPSGETTLSCGGLADRRTARPVGPATTFHWFSTTKPITALAVLQLAARGRVDLEAPLLQYLPDLPYRNGATVRQVLSHQAGLPNPLPLRWVHRAEDHPTFDARAFVDRVLHEHPRCTTPGRRARYSNIGFLLLGRLVEVVDGRPYPDYVRSEILDVVRPADNRDAWLGFAAPEGNRHATGYTRRRSVLGAFVRLMPDPLRLQHREGAWVRYNPFYLDGAAYGGLVGNALGWAPLLSAIAGRDPRLLPPALYPRYFEPQALASGRPSGHAASWFVGTLDGHPYRCHAGGGPGYGAENPGLSRARSRERARVRHDVGHRHPHAQSTRRRVAGPRLRGLSFRGLSFPQVMSGEDCPSGGLSFPQVMSAGRTRGRGRSRPTGWPLPIGPGRACPLGTGRVPREGR